MSRGKQVLAGAALLMVVAGAVAVVGLLIARSASARACGVCERPIPMQSRTIGLLDGKQQNFCCPACALSAHRQTGKPVRITHLTDYNRHTPLAPDQAYAVRDAQLHLCSDDGRVVDEAKHAHAAAFDRCRPTLFAFATEAAAERFRQQHGGRVLRFRDFAAAFEQ